MMVIACFSQALPTLGSSPGSDTLGICCFVSGALLLPFAHDVQVTHLASTRGEMRNKKKSKNTEEEKKEGGDDKNEEKYETRKEERERERQREE